MVKFLEVSSYADKSKVIVNFDAIVSITEEPDGTAYINLLFPDNDDRILGIHTSDSYVSIFNSLVEMELI